MKKYNRDEAIAWLIARSILLLITIVFIVYLFVKQDCSGSGEFLQCRITWSLGDIIGVPLFLAGMFWMSGIIKGVSNLLNPPGSSMWNYICFAGMVSGVILFWFL